MWWEAVRPTLGAGEVVGPGVRWGHTCNTIEGGKCLYVFGGYGADKCQTNDVHVFDTVTQTWRKPMTKGDPPCPRDSHSCTTVGSKLFVFGGTDGQKPLKDLHILDTTTNTWIQPILHGRGPNAREGHTAVLVDRRIFIFGGCGESSDTHQEVYYNDLFMLDTEQLIWKHVVTSGNPPSGRDSHSCSSWKNKLIVIGGEDSSDCYLSDVHILDTETLAWEKMSTTGQAFPPRAGHTTLTLGSNLFVFGGFRDDRNLYDDLHVLNVEKCTWNNIAPVNWGPSARFSVAGDCLDEQKGILVLIGGCNQSLEALDDIYYLHTDMPMTNGLLAQRKERSIKRALKRKCQEEYAPRERSEKISDVTGLQVAADPIQSEYMQQSSQAGTNIHDPKPPKSIEFEARITNANHHGFAIETIIDGKVLHGMLFSGTSISEDSDAYPNKRIASETRYCKRNIHQPVFTENTTVRMEKKSSAHRVTYAHHKGLTPQQIPIKSLAFDSAISTCDTSADQPIMPEGKLESSTVPDQDQNVKPVLNCPKELSGQI
ncbi:uncharacterized protein [Typha angustifolia]|uniref:uncharacterized protein isoform X1 n=1 Tax=Typha angustifolia TaxID=59011 RepID=UPI003C2E9157